MICKCRDCGRPVDTATKQLYCNTCLKEHQRAYVRRWREDHRQQVKAQYVPRTEGKFKIVGAVKDVDSLSCFFGSLFSRLDFMETVKMGFFDGVVAEVEGKQIQVENRKVFESGGLIQDGGE